jgi:hypothetical protein
MHITKKQEDEIKKIVISLIDISERAIKEDPKNPRMNAELGLPGLKYIRDIFTESDIHE